MVRVTEAEVDLEVGEQWRGRPVLNEPGSSLRSDLDFCSRCDDLDW